MWRVKSLDAILATAEKKSLHRSLGPFQLTMLGIGAIIGTGIFVLTAEAAQKAGPGMMLAFIIAGFVCAVAALCYAEMAAMVPVSGSAYTYSYAVMGELLAWMVGWAPDAGHCGPCPCPTIGHRAALFLCPRLVSAQSRSRGRARLG